MGFLASLVAPDPQRVNAAFQEGFWENFLTKSAAGKSVSVETALQVMAVLGCVKVISEDVAQVSRGLFKKRDGDSGGSDERRDHQIGRLFLRRANEWQTGFEFLETLVIHTALAGRFIAFKNVVRGQIRELIPFQPHQVEPVMVEIAGGRRQLVYRATLNGESKDLPPSAVWHVKGPSWNGWDGMEVLKLAREAIGLSIATGESHSLMHANGAQASGIYSVDGNLDDKQYKALRDWIDKSVTGSNKFKPFVLDRGGKWIQTAMSGVDAQHIETRKFQIEEVCRAFRVMPIMIGFSDKTATFASAEQMFQAHVKYTLGAWFRRLEESIGTNLLTDDEWSQGFYFKFLPISLLRGTEKDRGEFYYRMWQMGALNPNQIRGMEEMNPYEGGDVYRVPVNMAGTDDEPKDDVPPGGQPAEPQNRHRLNVGRVLSARNERRIRDAETNLQDVLAELGEQQEPQE
jgi:HK97 family phage portal protein